jgi:predicted dehydrogenase
MERVGVGIIGVGGYGRTHLAAIRAAEELGLARLVAAVILPGLEPETEKQLRARGVLIYRSHEEMLTRARREAAAGMELVGIPCGIDQHAPLSIAALRAGYHVLCEKPVAGNLPDALAMQRAARETGRILAIGYQNMYTRSMQRIKEIALVGLRGDGLGRLLAAKSCALWPRDSRYYSRNAWAGRLAVGGRPIYDSPVQNATAHYLQDLLYVAGVDLRSSATPARIYGENYRAKGIESADTQFLRISTREGPVLTYMVTHSATVMRGPTAEYRFERGLIRWETAEGNVRAEVRAGDPGAGTELPVVETLENDQNEASELPYQAVSRAIREGGEPIATIHNSLQHTMCVDTLFTKCPIIPIGAEHTRTDGTDPALTHIVGIDDLLARMYERAESYSEAGALWARRGVETEL